MSDPDTGIVDLVTKVLTSYQEQDNKELPIFMGFVYPEGSVEFAYNYCSPTDLRLISGALEDEAILRMLALNQDRLQRFIDEANSEDDSE